jgi:hypothetical protein
MEEDGGIEQSLVLSVVFVDGRGWEMSGVGK